MDLIELASRFAIDAPPQRVEPLGNGNVNATYRVDTAAGGSYVLQRLNTAVFARPDLVMSNLAALAGHAVPPPDWRLPLPVPVAGHEAFLLEHNGHPWRMLTFIDGAHSVDVVADPDQAAEIGRALGRFHALIHDLPAEQLADTLEGFHITPRYYSDYCAQLDSCRGGSGAGAERLGDPRAQWCEAFVNAREALVPVLEQAKADGRLQLQPIHGDPKVNNVMLCAATGCAVAMVDLDTLKPGLLHYDIGDLLRSGCNPAGEETTDLEAVHFDLDLARAMLGGYLVEAGALLGPDDRVHLFDAIRLLPFELGLRFFSDHLAGDVYFTVNRPDHNLERALVQFRLTTSIEQQEGAIRALLAEQLAALDAA